MTVQNFLISGSSVAVRWQLKMRTTTEIMPTPQEFPGFGGSSGSALNFLTEFKKLYTVINGDTKIIYCVY